MSFLKKSQNIEHLRHTLAHLLAAAVRDLYPHALPTIGPAIENGFYYDFDFSASQSADSRGQNADKRGITEEDLKKIETRMRELLPSWKKFEHREVSASEARDYFTHATKGGNKYKIELIDDLERAKEVITLYTVGTFTDLCRGGHVEHPASDIKADAFMLSHLAGAYWRGDEKNAQLTRIYGLAFANKKELDEYIEMQEEAKKRDHKKLGRELDLFTFSELVGPGLPLWTPKGTLVRELLDDFVWELRKERGYVKVEIPHITKKDLFVTSGHWSKFNDQLFKSTTREGHEFALKPMNCPFHTQIFARRPWSYRDMPQRYSNTTMCYRDEQTGELSGLSRVRAFTQDDAHVFCRESQVKDEAFKIWDIVEAFYGAFGFELKLRLSTHDPEHMDKFLGDISVWESAVANFKDWLKERKAEYIVGVGEAAFYGPKIDFIAKDSLGREWQVATIQADRNMPESFDLTYTNEEGAPERVVMLHAAIMGSIERFLSVMIEHTAGNFPLWLSPVQVKILPLSDKFMKYAEGVAEKLRNAGIRIELDDSAETLGKKIRNWKLEKVPYALVLGEQEEKKKEVTLESRDKGKVGALSVEKLLEKLLKERKERK